MIGDMLKLQPLQMQGVDVQSTRNITNQKSHVVQSTLNTVRSPLGAKDGKERLRHAMQDR